MARPKELIDSPKAASYAVKVCRNWRGRGYPGFGGRRVSAQGHLKRAVHLALIDPFLEVADKPPRYGLSG